MRRYKGFAGHSHGSKSLVRICVQLQIMFGPVKTSQNIDAVRGTVLAMAALRFFRLSFADAPHFIIHKNSTHRAIALWPL